MIAVTNNARHVRYTTFSVGGGTLMLVLEVNYKDPRAIAALGEFAEDALATVPEYTDDTLRRVVERISERVSDERFLRTIGAVIFTGVHVFAGHVDVCNVGDIRVHLVDDEGSAIHSTRDHNALSDDEDGVYSGTNHIGLEWVLTRTLPYALEGRSRPPDYFRWDVPAGSKLVTCSSLTHRFRLPSEYIPSLVPVNGALQGVPENGFAALITGPS